MVLVVQVVVSMIKQKHPGRSDEGTRTSSCQGMSSLMFPSREGDHAFEGDVTKDSLRAWGSEGTTHDESTRTRSGEDVKLEGTNATPLG